MVPNIITKMNTAEKEEKRINLDKCIAKLEMGLW